MSAFSVRLLLLLGWIFPAATASGAGMSSSEAFLKGLLDEAKKGKAFALEEIAGNGWDEAHLFTPYTDMETIDKRLGFKWNEPAKAKIAEDDEINLLVFVKKGKVVAAHVIPRTHCDFLGFPPRPLKKGHVRMLGKTNRFGACAMQLLKKKD